MQCTTKPLFPSKGFGKTLSSPIRQYIRRKTAYITQIERDRLASHQINASASEQQKHTMTTEWVSKNIELPPYPRGCHVVTRNIFQLLPEIQEFQIGLAHFFIQHTSASLTINENASPDVPLDLADAMDRIAPEQGVHYRHDEEGPDDMPAHVKSSLLGAGLTVPIQAGRLAMGIWQGIYLNEHRNYGGPRTIVVTIQGLKRPDGRKYSAYQV